MLTVYFCSVTLFVMSALSLQRTNLAMRAAQVSRDLQQAFWLAEAAMDSAAVRLATEQLVDGVPYEISSVTGKAAFTLYTDSAAITAPGEDGSARMKLTRRIVGQGTAASGVTSSVSAYFTQEGPAQGVWGNGMVVAHGGAVHPDVFFTGSMRSQLGAMASVVDADASLLRYHGVAQAADLKDLAARSSQDLVSLKNGYKYLQGITGEDDSGMKYVEGSQQMSIPYVSGEATIGELPSIQTAQLPTSINPAECQGT
ncbi:MAG: hypothetical protein HY601_00960, partial [Candidatus Omnitrophica bacterium]|nr:hypothetical protein [Candidatus Omnitrophota bacterium]